MDDATDTVTDNRAGGRYELVVEGVTAFAEYELEGGRMVLPHTVVPPAIGGRGVAGRLVKAVLEDARSRGLKVVPACSYVAAYIRRHPEFADLLA